MTKLAKKLQKIPLIYLPLFACLLFELFPFYWCLITAFKGEKEILSKVVTYIPKSPTWENFIYAWQKAGFAGYFRNSIIVSLAVVVGVLICALLLSYAMTRYKFKGRKLCLYALLGAQFLPASMMIIPLFITYKNLHLIDSLWSVILSTVTFNIPYCSILMIGFMKSVPLEIEEAAVIDGCNRMQSLLRIVCPVLRPGLVAVGSFAFINAWKEYLYTLMFINSSSKLTVSVGLSSMMSEYSIAYGLLAAGCIIAIIPPIIAFSFVQKYLVEGLAAGAVKG